MNDMLIAAKAAKKEIAQLSTEQKNQALHAMADALIKHQEQILSANSLDLEQASATISPVMLDRLRLTSDRIAAMAHGIREVAKLPDPIGRKLDEYIRADNLKISKISCSSHSFLMPFKNSGPAG